MPRTKMRVCSLCWLPAFVVASFAATVVGRAQSGHVLPDTTMIRRHVEILAHDSLEGRSTGTRGGAAAATYLEQQLRSWGIQPAGSDGSYRQSVPVHAAVPRRADLSLLHAGDTVRPALWDDILLLSSGDQTLIAAPVPLVFAGYGIVAPEHDYNDYLGVDVQGSVVVLLAGEPPSSDPDYFAGDQLSVHSTLHRKMQEALARGARGTIVVTTPRDPITRDWEHWRQELAFEDVRLSYGVPDQLHLLWHPRMGPALFRGAPMNFGEILRRDSLGGIRSFRMPATMTFRAAFQQRDAVAANIAGLIPGSDPALRSTSVLVGAHYDHLGIGAPVDGDSIYNGLFDNAIGTAVLLEISRLLSQEASSLRRSVLVVFFTGEEKGLLGSRVYASNPLRPLSSTVAMVNIDGIAAFERFRSVIPVGADLSELAGIVGSIASRHGLTIETVPEVFLGRDPLSSSDHWPFIEAGIPSVLLMEGFQYESTSTEEGLQRFIEWGLRTYHQPQDDLRQRADFGAVMQHAGVIADLIRELANTDAPPEWLPGTPYATARLRSQAEGR
ncbi:MAG: M28 family peptidase [Bacteroidetes bacterium]|nr:M28 family peptidase [Bacteroidota bacterium]